MSYSRAQRDPYWAVAIHRMQPNVAEIIRQLHAVIQRSPSLKPHLWLGSGWRNDSFSSEHGSGRAIDIMVSSDVGRTPTDAQRAAGLALANWLIANHKAIGVQWIIFSRDSKYRGEIWNPARGGWRAMENRGSISGNHVDHLHVYFASSAKWPASLNSAVVGGTPDTRTPIERLIDTMDEKKLRQIIREEAQTAARAEKYTAIGDKKHGGLWGTSMANMIGHASTALQRIEAKLDKLLAAKPSDQKAAK